MNSGDKTYIWQQTDWPNWTYSLGRLAPLLAKVHQARGVLLGRMHDSTADLHGQACLRALTSRK